MLMKSTAESAGHRKTVRAALEVADGQRPAVAVELPDGRLVTAKLPAARRLLGRAAQRLKTLGKLMMRELISPESSSYSAAQVEHMGHNPRLRRGAYRALNAR